MRDRERLELCAVVGLGRAGRAGWLAAGVERHAGFGAGGNPAGDALRRHFSLAFDHFDRHILAGLRLEIGRRAKLDVHAVGAERDCADAFGRLHQDAAVGGGCAGRVADAGLEEEGELPVFGGGAFDLHVAEQQQRDILPRHGFGDVGLHLYEGDPPFLRLGVHRAEAQRLDGGEVYDVAGLVEIQAFDAGLRDGVQPDVAVANLVATCAGAVGVGGVKRLGDQLRAHLLGYCRNDGEGRR